MRMESSKTTSVRIWDLPVRLFHWLLVLGIGFSWFTAETGGNWMIWHERCGILLLSLILFRLVWGVVGSDTARFARFLGAPRQALQHLHEVRDQQTAYHAGHNPLGGWMVVALLLLVLFQAITGLFANDDIMTEGPLSGLVSGKTSDWLTGLHHLGFNLLLLLVGVHVVAILFYRLAKRTNLIKAMVTGSADWPLAQQPLPPPMGFRSPLLALVIGLICYGLVRVVIHLLST